MTNFSGYNPSVQEFLPGHKCEYEIRTDIPAPVIFNEKSPTQSSRIVVGVRCIVEGCGAIMWLAYEPDSQGMGLVWVDSLTILSGDGNYNQWVERKTESLIRQGGPDNPPMFPPVLLNKEVYEEDMARRKGRWPTGD